jgi:hypothetical protein
MLTKEGTVLDRREQLRVKVKSLAAEASMIRREEKKQYRHARKLKVPPVLADELRDHRRRFVRPEARSAHLAYGFIRGMPYEAMERSAKKPPNWEQVKRLCHKFGPTPFTLALPDGHPEKPKS